MARPIILASGSSVRTQLLRNAAVDHETVVARIDEQMIKQSLQAADASPRDIADKLAEMKALKVSEKHPGALVIGCDQILEAEGGLMSKPTTQADAIEQLKNLRAKSHSLLSAAVVVEDSKPVWRHIGHVRLTMRDASDAYLQNYVTRNWDSISEAVGAYKLEEEGVRLFSRIEGDYFHVLGMPLLELLAFLTLRGEIDA